MSKDSSHTYIHLHASHHADLFEEFCHPPSSSNPVNSQSQNNNANPSSPHHHHHHHPNGPTTTASDPTMIQLPGHFLPFEEIALPPHLMPVNPEDEDDVVPDMHAAFGIQRALNGSAAVSAMHGAAAASGAVSGRTGEGSGRGVQGEPVWRDLGLEGLMGGLSVGEERRRNGGGSSVVDVRSSGAARRRREGRRFGIMSVR